MVLVDAVGGESQNKLQSSPHALHHSGYRFKFGSRTIRNGNWASLLFKRTKLTNFYYSLPMMSINFSGQHRNVSSAPMN